jgi:O-antigen/teichoic acid export membrane protein
MNPLKGFLAGSVLARNTLWMLGGQGVRLSLQAVYFILIARALGAQQYGAFVGAVSLVALIAPFCSWGTGFILIKEVARNRNTFRQYWGAALGVTVLGGCILLCLALTVSHAIWGNSVPLKALLLVGISDAIVIRILELAVQAFTAVEALRKCAEINIVLSVTRTLAAICLCFGVRSPSAVSWAFLYLVGAVAATAYAVAAVTLALGRPSLGLRLSRAELHEGFYFAVSQASATVYNDVDKTMLVRLGGLEVTGIYGAAYRIVDVSFAPLSALVSATAARFFRHGTTGIAGSTRFARKLLPYSAAYGLLATASLFLGSSVLPAILGKGFAATALALRWLSPLVFLRSVHYFLADSLSTAGHQRRRASVQLGIVGLNVLLNLWLIPIFSWRGAAWASLASDGALVLGLFVAIVSIRRDAETSQVTGSVEGRLAS